MKGFIAGLLLLSLAACSSSDDDDNGVDSEGGEETWLASADGTLEVSL